MVKRFFPALFVLVGIYGFARVHPAGPVVELASPQPEREGYFGISVSGTGDINGDGRGDVVVGAFAEAEQALEDAGRAYIFDGASGALLRTLASPSPEEFGQFGRFVAGAGDVDGDGAGDVIVGATLEDGGAEDAGRAYVFSGSDGALLHTLESPGAELNGRFGVPVAGAGDVDGDGRGDVVVGAFLEDGAGVAGSGRAYLFSGSDGALLHTFESLFPDESGGFGMAVAGLGDVDGDGRGDVAVGAPQENAPDLDDTGRVYAFSGASGDTLFTVQSPQRERSGFGFAVSGAGDTDGDGVRDLVVGAYLETGGGVQGAGRAYVFSGAQGTLIAPLDPPNPEKNGRFGYAVAGARPGQDATDGEVIVGAPYESSEFAVRVGRAYVFDGGGAWLATLASPQPAEDGFFGFTLGAVGDTDGDGVPDAAVGAYGEDGVGFFDDGRAYVLSTDGTSGPATASEPVSGSFPEAFGLEPNYPNPFHATTTVRYRVARGGHVRLEVYNETGQRVETLVDGFATSGTHTVEWDAGDLGAGVYFCRMEAGEEASVRAFVVLN